MRIAETLDKLLSEPAKREVLGRSARQRVHDNFLVFTQVKSWLELLTNTVTDRWPKD